MKKADRLTRAQLQMMERVQAYPNLVWGGNKRVNQISVLHALSRKGYVIMLRSNCANITDAGRAALKESAHAQEI